MGGARRPRSASVRPETRRRRRRRRRRQRAWVHPPPPPRSVQHAHGRRAAHHPVYRVATATEPLGARARLWAALARLRRQWPVAPVHPCQSPPRSPSPSSRPSSAPYSHELRVLRIRPRSAALPATRGLAPGCVFEANAGAWCTGTPPSTPPAPHHAAHHAPHSAPEAFAGGLHRGGQYERGGWAGWELDEGGLASRPLDAKRTRPNTASGARRRHPS